VGNVACVEEMRNAYKILVRKSEGKFSLRKHPCKWENNIEMCLKKVEWKGVNWIHMAQNVD
jgi:hypothetical protein